MASIVRANGGEQGLVLSLDFELNWGLLSRQDAGKHARLMGARAVIPHLLALFEEFDIACTWAITGPLFFDDRDALLSAWPKVRPVYDDPALSSYDHAQTIGPNEEADPLHFGLSLVRRIAETPKQEIATHTFSHYYCLDTRDALVSFEADLDAAMRCGLDLDRPIRTIVFPRNQTSAAALGVCARHGLTAFRGNASGWGDRALASANEKLTKRAYRLANSYLPLSGAGAVVPGVRNGMVDVSASCFLRSHSPRRAAFEPQRLRRVRGMMRSAARAGRVCHLWSHPHNFGVHQDKSLGFLRAVLEEADVLRDTYGWESRTMGEVAERTLARCHAQVATDAAQERPVVPHGAE